METNQFKLTFLKQDLKVTLIKLKWPKKSHARQVINSKFINNTKLVYRHFKCSSITVNQTRNNSEAEEFWQSIWRKETKINKNAKWLKN